LQQNHKSNLTSLIKLVFFITVLEQTEWVIKHTLVKSPLNSLIVSFSLFKTVVEQTEWVRRDSSPVFEKNVYVTHYSNHDQGEFTHVAFGVCVRVCLCVFACVCVCLRAGVCKFYLHINIAGI
jgi:hypothetical protein